MARGSSKKINSREIDRDSVYTEFSIAKLINNMMIGGEKQKSAKIVYAALENAHKLVNIDITISKLINTALSNLEPSKKAVNRIVRGRSLQVPQDMTAAQKANQSVKILVKCSRDFRKKKGIPMCEALAEMIKSSYNNTGEGVDLKKSIEAVADKNKAYKI